MTALNYSFAERLAMSNGVAVSGRVEEILTANIPGATRVWKSEESDDRRGTDWWVERTNGTPLSVDLKARERDWWATHPTEDDLALETWSVVERNKIGWTLDATKRTDRVLFLWKDTGRWCLIPFPELCGVFTERCQEWKARHRIERQHTDNWYHSECVFVPRLEVQRAIHRKYGGNAIAA